MEAIRPIKVNLIRESATNVRRYFDPAKQAEINASVAVVGVQSPLLLRPVATPEGTVLEVVFGHRRFRAAKAAGHAEVPAEVRNMSDQAAHDAQMIENLQRADLHPLEEADAIRRAHDDYGENVEDIATVLAKSKGYVYQRLALARLPEAGRQAFLVGKLSAGAALALARMPNEDLQAQALERLLGWVREEDAEPITGADAQRMIEREYTLRLDRAPFDRGAADLLKDTGPCTTCPHRTGSQPELFADVSSPDLCTKPPCYRAKVDATWELKAKAAEKAKLTVISEKKAKELFPYSGQLAYNSPYVELSEVCHDDPKRRTYAKLLGDKAPEQAALARDPQGGIHDLYDRKAITKAIKAAGHDFSSKSEAKDKLDEYSKKQKEREELSKQREKVGAEALRRVMEKADTVLSALWGVAVQEMDETSTISAEVLKKYGVKPKQLAHQVAMMEIEVLLRFVLELWLTPSYYDHDEWPEVLVDACAAAGVDLEGLAAEMAPKPVEEPVKKPAPAKKPAAAKTKKGGGK